MLLWQHFLIGMLKARRAQVSSRLGGFSTVSFSLSVLSLGSFSNNVEIKLQISRV